VRDNVRVLRQVEFEHVLETDEGAMAKVEMAMATNLEEFVKRSEVYEPLISSPKERQLWDQFKQAREGYMRTHEQLLAVSRKNQTEDARSLLAGASKLEAAKMAETLEQLVALNTQGGEQASRDGDVIYANSMMAIALAIGISLALGLGLALVLANGIAKPVVQVVEEINRVASGDLSHVPMTDRADEVGDIQRSLARMVDQLRVIVEDVRIGADSVATASSQIAHGTSDLSGRTEEQASSLEQTAASVEEMSGTVRQPVGQCSLQCGAARR